MSDLLDLFRAQEKSARWKAEMENATARLELAQIEERCTYLISQAEPVNSLRLERADLRLVFRYIQHGNLDRLRREQEELYHAK